MKRADNLGLFLVKLAGATVVSFLLFVVFSLLHGFFGAGHQQDKSEDKGKRIIAEMIKKPKQEQKQAQQRIRKVSSSASRESSRASDQMMMKFMPDLAADAGSGAGGVEMQTRELAAEVFEEGEVDQVATPEYRPPVAYPDRAREMGVQGTVEVNFVVNHQGKVTSVDVTKSPSPLLSSEVRRTIPSWRFKPAKKKGVPVNMRFRQSIEFKVE